MRSTIILATVSVLAVAASAGCSKRAEPVGTTQTTSGEAPRHETTYNNNTTSNTPNGNPATGGVVANGNGTVVDTQKAEKDRAADIRDDATNRADFLRKREDYRHDRASDLVDLDEKIGKLEAKEKTATGKTKAEIDVALKDIRAKRAVFKRDFDALGRSTAASWDDTKARLDHEWDDVKSALDKAPSTI